MDSKPEGSAMDPSQSRNSAEWGLAALIAAGILAVLAMLVLQINLQLFFSPRSWTRRDLLPLYYAGVIGGIFPLALALGSIVFSTRSLVLAYTRRQPCALGWAGLAIGIVALLLWVAAFADFISVTQMLLRASRG